MQHRDPERLANSGFGVGFVIDGDAVSSALRNDSSDLKSSVNDLPYLSTLGTTELLHLAAKLLLPDSLQASVVAQVDPGASRSFISEDLLRRLGVKPAEYTRESIQGQNAKVQLANGSVVQCVGEMELNLEVRDIAGLGFMLKVHTLVLSGLQHNVVLGYDFSRTSNPAIDWTARSLTFGHRVVLGTSNSTVGASNVELCSVKQLRRGARKSGKAVWLALLKPLADFPDAS